MKLQHGITQDLAYDIRRLSLEMVHRVDASHIGGALSMADILAVLYQDVLRLRPEEPDWEDRDRFILSKGHCCAALYAVLALKGFFDPRELEEYGKEGSRLMCHASHKVPGVEWSTGSLGHGLGLGCGQALAARRKGKDWHVYVMLSDGEMNEGSIWEAVMFAGHHRLSNLRAVIDANQIQSLGTTKEVMDLAPLAPKLTQFGWHATDVDGHDISSIRQAFEALGSDKPGVLIAHTVKGKGVSFMENKLEWHYRSPKTTELLQKAQDELRMYYRGEGRDRA